MKREFYTQFIFIIAVFFMANTVFSNTDKANNEDLLTISLIFSSISGDEMQDGILTIHKTTKKGLDVYTFTPEKKSDKEFLAAIDNRLKNMIEGFVSVSANDKNVVEIVTDPTKITEEGLELTMAIVIKFYEYYRGNYKIEE